MKNGNHTRDNANVKYVHLYNLSYGVSVVNSSPYPNNLIIVASLLQKMFLMEQRICEIKFGDHRLLYPLQYEIVLKKSQMLSINH